MRAFRLIQVLVLGASISAVVSACHKPAVSRPKAGADAAGKAVICDSAKAIEAAVAKVESEQKIARTDMQVAEIPLKSRVLKDVKDLKSMVSSKQIVVVYKKGEGSAMSSVFVTEDECKANVAIETAVQASQTESLKELPCDFQKTAKEDEAIASQTYVDAQSPYEEVFQTALNEMYVLGPQGLAIYLLAHDTCEEIGKSRAPLMAAPLVGAATQTASAK